MRPIGHIGGAFVLTAIVISTLDDSAVLWFTAVAVAGSLFPDIDFYLPHFLHQGVIHTYSVMLLVSVASGLLAAGVAAMISGREDSVSEMRAAHARGVFILTTGAMVLGTFSHITLDAVAYRESFTSLPVEPLWPLTDWVPRINLFPPHTPAWNYGFLIIGAALWLIVFWVKR